MALSATIRGIGVQDCGILKFDLGYDEVVSLVDANVYKAGGRVCHRGRSVCSTTWFGIVPSSKVVI